MTSKRRSRRTAMQVAQLLDLAREMEQGFTFADVNERLDWSLPQFVRVVRKFREMFAEGPLTLPCTPQGLRARWLYRLTSEQEPITAWHNNRLLDAEERLQTMYNIACSAVRATDADTLEGKRARLIYKQLGRLHEDLGELSGEVSEWRQLPLRMPGT